MESSCNQGMGKSICNSVNHCEAGSKDGYKWWLYDIGNDNSKYA